MKSLFQAMQGKDPQTFFDDIAEERAKNHRGALRWCKRCGDKHYSQESCGLVEVQRIAKSGKTVTRYTPKRFAEES